MATPLRIATTTSVDNSGLSTILNAAFYAWQNDQYGQLNYQLIWDPLGSGAAMDKARQGLADAVVSHERVGEMEFWAERFALARHHIFYNYFVLVGPTDSAFAGTTLEQGFTYIANNNYKYVSRGAGGRSGTYVREQQILKLFNLTLGNVDTAPGSPNPDMMATLGYANNHPGSYTFTDIGTWYQFLAVNTDPLLLKILTSPHDYLKDDLPRDPLASNQYVLMPVNPFACFSPAVNPSSINVDGARAFLAWLHTSSGANNARDAVNTYLVNITPPPPTAPTFKQGFIYNACSEHFPDNKCLIKLIPKE